MRIKQSILFLLIGVVLPALVLAACGSSGGVIKTVEMDGASMEPTIKAGQTVDVLKTDSDPVTGDIICIEKGEQYVKPLIKRVIATEGQQLKIDFDKNEVYVDGKKLEEPYIQGVTKRGDLPDDEVNGVIPEGKLFVMGDNRSISLDSRYSSVGLIDKENVVGIVNIPET